MTSFCGFRRWIRLAKLLREGLTPLPAELVIIPHPRAFNASRKCRNTARKTAMRGFVLQTFADSCFTSAIQMTSRFASKPSNAADSASNWSPRTRMRREILDMRKPKGPCPKPDSFIKHPKPRWSHHMR